MARLQFIPQIIPNSFYDGVFYDGLVQIHFSKAHND